MAPRVSDSAPWEQQETLRAIKNLLSQGRDTDTHQVWQELRAWHPGLSYDRVYTALYLLLQAGLIEDRRDTGAHEWHPAPGQEAE